jgi:hypothetical protein
MNRKIAPAEANTEAAYGDDAIARLAELHGLNLALEDKAGFYAAVREMLSAIKSTKTLRPMMQEPAPAFRLDYWPTGREGVDQP